ncbi:MAG TPA: MlaD family protein [Steroidobacteraceae bacterium]|nr:MlaD family protein [Steroidobacteraceae bacterium]
MNAPAQAPPEPRRTSAVVHPTRSPGWIWAVPLAALGIVIWLLVRSIASRGIDVSVSFEDAYGMQAGSTKVLYRGITVGRLSRLVLSGDKRHVVATLDLDEDLADLLRAGTQFYLQGARPSFSNPASLKSIVSGPTIVLVPGRGGPRRDFIGIASSPPETLTVAVPYQVSFTGDVGAMQPGSPVTLRGFTVGVVRSVRLEVDPQSGQISTPVVLDLDPTKFHLHPSGAAPDAWFSTMNATLTNLVRRGLRARLTQIPPLLGAEQVTLEMVPAASPAEVHFGGRFPQIPAVEGGGLEQLPTTIAHLPIAQIADNVRAITANLRSLSASPQLRASIRHLDDTLQVLDRTMRQAGPQVAPTLESVRETVDSLRRTASEIDATALAAKHIVGGTASAPSGNLQQSLLELTDAARAVRSFANYLDQHPEALIRGR